MWRRKKFIIMAVLTAIVLASILGGVAIASADDETTPANPFTTLLNKVAAIYQQNTGTAIDPVELQKAFTEAQKQIRDEALDKYLQNLVDKGKITQDQAKQYKEWRNARPDVPIGPGFKGGMRGFGKLGPMFRGWCAPPPPSPE